jgi:hypothetical protein
LWTRLCNSFFSVTRCLAFPLPLLKEKDARTPSPGSRPDNSPSKFPDSTATSDVLAQKRKPRIAFLFRKQALIIYNHQEQKASVFSKFFKDFFRAQRAVFQGLRDF